MFSRAKTLISECSAGKLDVLVPRVGALVGRVTIITKKTFGACRLLPPNFSMNYSFDVVCALVGHVRFGH